MQHVPIHDSPSHTLHQLAMRDGVKANARVAIAEGSLQSAQDCIVKAVADVENFDLPLAAWRGHAKTAVLPGSTGNIRAAQRGQETIQATIVKLDESLERP